MAQATDSGKTGKNRANGDQDKAKTHADVTKNKSQSNIAATYAANESSSMKTGDYEVKTPSGIAGSGLKGINRPSNDSASKSVGSGGGASNQSSKSGMGGGAPRWSNDSCNKNFGA